MKTLSIVAIGVTILFFGSARMASADPQPPELGVGSIQLVPLSLPTPQPKPTGPMGLRPADYLQIRLYCGGMYGGSYLAGRVVVVEMREAGKPTRVIHQRTLPAISSTTGYSFIVPVPNGRFTTTTTIRVRFTTSDAKPANDSLTRTFYQFKLNLSFSQNAHVRQAYGLQPEAKVRRVP